MAEKMIGIPRAVLESAQSLDEIEDWLCANNPRFIEDLKRIRREEDLVGKGITLEEATEEWGIKNPPFR